MDSLNLNDLASKPNTAKSAEAEDTTADDDIVCDAQVTTHVKKAPRVKSQHFKYIRFIIISALKLKMNEITLATACSIFHRFFKLCKLEDFDPYLIATSAMYLASKIEEQEIRLRDIINVTYRTLHGGGGGGPDLPMLEVDEKYWTLRTSVVQIELLVVRVLSFELDFQHPHKYLLQYLECLKHWIPLDQVVDNGDSSPLAEVAWFMLRDMLHSDISLRYRPQEVAIAIIYLTSICYGVHIPCDPTAAARSGDDYKHWWTALDDKTSLGRVHEIIEEILDVYDVEDDAQFAFKY